MTILHTDLDITFRQLMLCLAQWWKKQDIHHIGDPNHLKRTFETSKKIFSSHGLIADLPHDPDHDKFSGNRGS